MKISNWSFKPELVPTLAACTLFVLFVLLGFWQLERAEIKQAMFETYEMKRAMPALDLNSVAIKTAPVEELFWREAILRGKFLSSTEFLLDNRIENGVAGYHVFTPFLLPGDDMPVMVNRGWVASDGYRHVLPEINTPLETLILQGTIYPPPSQNTTATAEEFENGVTRIQSVNLETMARVSGYSPAPFLIRLAPDSPGGYLRNWIEPGAGSERHIGYAVQWFGLAFVLTIIFFSRTIKKQNNNTHA